MLFQLSLTVQKKKIKIKALRKDPKALAKKENVVQLPRMKALFNLVCLFFSRLKIATKISLQMCINMCTFRPHITVLTYILSWYPTERHAYVCMCFVLFFNINSDLGFWLGWHVEMSGSHGYGEADSFSFNMQHHFQGIDH